MPVSKVDSKNPNMPGRNAARQSRTSPKSLSLMVKPASFRCNMNCSYCFYKAEAGGRELPDRGLLSEADTEMLIRRLSEYLQPGDVLDIGFQGGEPSLLPASFYRDFAEKLESFCAAEIRWYFQTNGLRIDGEYCAYFREHKVLVGLSLDMTEGFHDLYRKDNAGKGTWNRVMKTKRLLDREGIDYNILAVLTPAMAKHPDKIWNFIRREDLRYLQFLPAFSIEEAEGRCSSCTLTPELYAAFYERLAELWLEALKRGEYYSVKLFDDLVHLLRGEGIHACGLCGSCEPQLVLEADLSAYPCDFYCKDEFLLGNLKEREIGSLLEAGSTFRKRGRQLPSACTACPYKQICGGGCPVLFPFTCIPSGTSGPCGQRQLLRKIISVL